MSDKVVRAFNGGGVVLVVVRDLFLAMCEMCVFRYKQHSSRDKPPRTPPRPTHPTPPCPLLSTHSAYSSVRVYAEQREEGAKCGWR